MKLESKFLNKYKKEMVDIMLKADPSLDEKFVESVVIDMIQENVRNPVVTLDNNYTGETRDTTLLSVLDWTFDRKPIICGNATFYKNQYEAMNPIAAMLKGFLSQRKAYKKQMFAVEDASSAKYKDLDRAQANEKINCNSYYGASGAPSSAFYSTYSGPACTHSAQQVISTAETLFEGFVADNYNFLNLTELIEWIRKVLKEYHKDYDDFDSFITLHSLFDVSDRLLNKIIDKQENDRIILEGYLSSLTDEELAILYYKNNLITFIDDHDIIKSLIFQIFENVENLEYAEKDDEEWFVNVVPDKYKDDFRGKSFKDWNKFVNIRYFMDPNNVPDSIESYVIALNDYLVKYVYCRYLSVDRIYRLKNFKRKVVTVIDTDSNILSLDTSIDYIMENVVQGCTFGREFENNIFICVNMLAYTLTQTVTDILLTYGEYSNVPEEFRPIYNMKNEFLFLKLVIGETKKRYISKIVLREGVLLKPVKYDVKGFDFKKASCSEFAEEYYMTLLKKYVINPENIMLQDLHRDLKQFKETIRCSIQRGERTYLPNGNAKEIQAYKAPEQEQSVRGVLAWNILNPDNVIELPAKISLLKLNIFTEDDISELKETHPEYYKLIIEKIFNDTTGMFVSVKEEPSITYVNVNDKEWYEKIPSKFRTTKKKLGPVAWNKFVDDMLDDETTDKKILKMQERYAEYLHPTVTKKKKGMQVISIPSNATIPEWLQPYIDYATMINNILAPFVPVLEIFKLQTIEEGKSKNGVDRKTNAFTNVIKF